MVISINALHPWNAVSPILLIELGMVNSARELQPRNAFWPMASTEGEMLIDLSAVQLENDQSSISFNADGRFNSTSLLHPLNAFLPIDSIDSGNWILRNAEHLLNALSPIDVIPGGRINDWREEHPSKTDSLMMVTDSERMMDFNDEQKRKADEWISSIELSNLTSSRFSNASNTDCPIPATGDWISTNFTLENAANISASRVKSNKGRITVAWSESHSANASGWMQVQDESNSIFARFLHFLKAPESTKLTELGITSSVKDGTFSKAPLPIVTKLSIKWIVFNDVQFEKLWSPKISRDGGNSNLVNDVHPSNALLPICVTDSCILISINDAHPLKAYDGICDIDIGTWKWRSEEQSEKAEHPSSEICPSIDILGSDEQTEKALSQIFVTVCGIEINDKDVHCKNNDCEMIVRFGGRMIFLIAEHLANKLSPKLVTFDGISTSFNEEQS